MCGIAGILERSGQVDKTVLQRMQTVLWHRGPDDSGLELIDLQDNISTQLGIAFDRLSIRDLSQTGHQPMWDEDRRVCIAMNGEIYNADELRSELNDAHFKGTSDTEVLLNLYLRKGLKETLRSLDGMYAICIVDLRYSKIYLIRDRIGEKPLYIYETNERLMFASEYKAFYCHPEFRPILDNDALSEYMLFRYPAGDRTFLQGVYNLTPGCYLELSGSSISKHRYWELPSPIDNRKSFEENKEALKKLIYESVRRRLISDRPVGIQLSGGVDSSYLCNVVKKGCDKDLETYSIIFDNELSEKPYIDIVNSQLGLNPRLFLDQPDSFIESWKQTTYHFEAPMNHEGSLALLQLNRMASKSVSVLLCGDGPDECMGGYERFHRIDRFLRKGHGLIWYGIKAKRLLKGQRFYKSRDDLFISSSQFVSDEDLSGLRPSRYRSDIRIAYRNRRSIMHMMHRGNGLRRYLNYEMVTYMQDILMRTDKMSMASSIEVRVPYLMPELLEFLQSVPESQLVNYRLQMMHGTKRLLKSLCEDIFGASFTYRYKEGLSVPTADFFKDTSCRDYIEKTLLPGIRKRGLMDFSYVMELWRKSEVGNALSVSNVQALWCALSFELWAQMYLDNSPLDYKTAV
jgi:asparagine synthase (glutamine-hydrolysing)